MRGASFWRLAGGSLVLILLAGFGILLLPVYVRNFQFERSLEKIAADTESSTRADDLLRVRVLDRAARLGLPIRPDQVRFRRSKEGLGIEVRYVVPIDLPLYSVDLHFHPSAGR